MKSTGEVAWTEQVPLTIVTSVKPGQVESLKRLLASMGQDPASNPVIPFGEFSQVHFARFVVLDATQDLNASAIQASLLLIGELDAPIDRFLDELITRSGAGLDRVYRHCEGYPDDALDPAQRRAYLLARTVKPETYYVNTVGRSVEQIRGEAHLRDALEQFIDRHGRDWKQLTPSQVRQRLRALVAADTSLRWAIGPRPRPGIAWRLRDAAELLGLPLATLLLAPLILLALPIALVLLRIHEVRDAAPHIRPVPAHVRELAALEDHGIQNQFSAIGFIKPGWFRRLTVLVVLLALNYSARHLYSRGNLAGVRTIHFARWVTIDEGRRAIFASNYDGSLESYMDDFIDRLSWGLNAVFSNGVGYPRTNWLFLDGAKDEEAFKDYLRVHQVPSLLWYSAYPGLTAVNIDNNARIRAGLRGGMSEAEAEAWLRRI
ncbi:MAG TPA: hypothetical protein VEL12_15570 [Candidatus Nitrosopolaris sp.]|nr:hypothetical protein [Candidatus Nitrosopolaris sp.]